MGTQGIVPLTLITCVVLLTGDIYYKTPAGAAPQSWGKANKYAAVFILIANIAWLIYLAVATPWRTETARIEPVVAIPPAPIEAPRLNEPIMTDSSLLPPKDEVADKLAAVAARINAKAPTVMNEETVLDSATADGRVLTLNHTTQRRAELVTTEQIEKGQRKLIQHTCESKLATWIAEGVTLRIRHFSSDGVQLSTVDVDANRCDTLKAHR